MARKAKTGKFARCVKAVTKRGGAYDPKAVCAAKHRKKKGNPSEAYQAGAASLRSAAARLGTVNLSPSIAQREEWRHAWGDFMKGWNAEKRRKNPAAQSAEAYQDFHGRPPDEMVEVKKQIHYHQHLAGAGKLEKLEVKAQDGATVTLSGFKGAILAFNEKRTQLFVEGGDQKVDLKQFGIRTAHEVQPLGEVVAVEYFTRKDHLRKADGGTAVYRHKFASPRPTLLYDVMNEQLSFAGGKYKVLPEGIDD